jgi:hypothetical protein
MSSEVDERFALRREADELEAEIRRRSKESMRLIDRKQEIERTLTPKWPCHIRDCERWADCIVPFTAKGGFEALVPMCDEHGTPHAQTHGVRSMTGWLPRIPVWPR